MSAGLAEGDSYSTAIPGIGRMFYKISPECQKPSTTFCTVDVERDTKFFIFLHAEVKSLAQFSHLHLLPVKLLSVPEWCYLFTCLINEDSEI